MKNTTIKNELKAAAQLIIIAPLLPAAFLLNWILK